MHPPPARHCLAPRPLVPPPPRNALRRRRPPPPRRPRDRAARRPQRRLGRLVQRPRPPRPRQRPPPPGPAARVIERLPDDWDWVLSVSCVEFAHGDLHLSNVVSLPSDPDARALLVDPACHPLPWAVESSYCRAVYWGSWTEHPDYPA